MAVTVVELDEVVTDLTWRWFGLEKRHEKIRIVTMNGVKFIEEAVTKKALFDVVLIDVCDEVGDVICPAESFIRPDFIENLKKILEPTGIVVLNILPHEDVLDQVDKIVHVYQKHFPTCAVTPLLREMNTILACQILQHDDAYTSQRLMSQRFQEAWSYFGFLQQFGVVKLSFINGKSKEENVA